MFFRVIQMFWITLNNSVQKNVMLLLEYYWQSAILLELMTTLKW